MAQEPSTPASAGRNMASLVATLGSLGLRSSKATEPSPASTFGETVIDGSSPATPQDIDVRTHFVRRSMNARLEDPFVEKTEGASNDPFAGNSLGSPQVHRRTQSTTALGRSESLSFSPRPDRAGQELSSANAQALLPPEACVFVANLTNGRTDEQLVESVESVFRVFGTCFAKIRRDKNKMPFAFVQYETADIAQKAIRDGRGLEIDGRKCRTEPAKVHRAVYLSRVDRGEVTVEEALRVLESHGPIEQVLTLSASDKALFRLPEGIWVKFAYFQDCRDAQEFFKGQQEYSLEAPPMPEDIRAEVSRALRVQYSSPGQQKSPSEKRQVKEEHLQSPLALSQQRRTQRKATSETPPEAPERTSQLGSLWIANLPHDVTQDQIEQAFRKYGHIRTVDVVKKANLRKPGAFVFAFISFRSDDAVVAALEDDEKPRINGFHVRIERKFLNPERPATTERRRPPRIIRPLHESPTASQRPRIPAAPDPLVVLGNVFNYSVGLGIPAAVAYEMISTGHRILLQGFPQPTPFEFPMQQQPPVAEQPREIYELADTSIPSPRAVQDTFIASPSPLRRRQSLDHLGIPAQAPPVPEFALLEGPPVADQLTPLVVSSNGTHHAPLVTTPPPPRGALPFAAVSETDGADNNQKTSLSSVGASLPVDSGEEW